MVVHGDSGQATSRLIPSHYNNDFKHKNIILTLNKNDHSGIGPLTESITTEVMAKSNKQSFSFLIEKGSREFLRRLTL